MSLSTWSCPLPKKASEAGDGRGEREDKGAFFPGSQNQEKAVGAAASGGPTAMSGHGLHFVGRG